MAWTRCRVRSRRRVAWRGAGTLGTAALIHAPRGGAAHACRVLLGPAPCRPRSGSSSSSCASLAPAEEGRSGRLFASRARSPGGTTSDPPLPRDRGRSGWALPSPREPGGCDSGRTGPRSRRNRRCSLGGAAGSGGRGCVAHPGMAPGLSRCVSAHPRGRENRGGLPRHHTPAPDTDAGSTCAAGCRFRSRRARPARASAAGSDRTLTHQVASAFSRRDRRLCDHWAALSSAGAARTVGVKP